MKGHDLYSCPFEQDSEDEDRYGEVYLNVDAVEGSVQFHEKDPEYLRAGSACAGDCRPTTG